MAYQLKGVELTIRTHRIRIHYINISTKPMEIKLNLSLMVPGNNQESGGGGERFGIPGSGGGDGEL